MKMLMVVDTSLLPLKIISEKIKAEIQRSVGYNSEFFWKEMFKIFWYLLTDILHNGNVSEGFKWSLLKALCNTVKEPNLEHAT